MNWSAATKFTFKDFDLIFFEFLLYIRIKLNPIFFSSKTSHNMDFPFNDLCNYRCLSGNSYEKRRFSDIWRRSRLCDDSVLKNNLSAPRWGRRGENNIITLKLIKNELFEDFCRNHCCSWRYSTELCSCKNWNSVPWSFIASQSQIWCKYLYSRRYEIT